MEYSFKCDCGIILRCQASSDAEGLRRLMIEGTKHTKSTHPEIKMTEKEMKKVGETIERGMKKK